MYGTDLMATANSGEEQYGIDASRAYRLFRTIFPLVMLHLPDQIPLRSVPTSISIFSIPTPPPGRSVS